MNEEELIKIRNQATKERDDLKKDFRNYSDSIPMINALSRLIEDLDEVIWLI